MSMASKRIQTMQKSKLVGRTLHQIVFNLVCSDGIIRQTFEETTNTKLQKSNYQGEHNGIKKFHDNY